MPLLKIWRMPRARYDAMVASGALEEDDPIELLDGLLVVKERQTPLHAATASAVEHVLRSVFSHGYHTRTRSPIALDDMSEPEPDVAVVSGEILDYLKAHPSKAALIAEVADTSLNKDRLVKAPLYARAGITDYWVINLVDEVLEVYRHPSKAPSRRFGWKYRSVKLLKRGATVTPLAAPRAKIRVADLLP
jgi:Uma2 family endonuclease